MFFSSNNRVVVTGVGILASNGIGIKDFWESLIHGKSGIRRITRFDASKLKSQIAGEVQNFDPSNYIPPSFKPKRKSRETQFALAATAMALSDAKLDLKKYRLDHPLPIVMGVTCSSFEMISQGTALVQEKGVQRASPSIITESSPHSVTTAISEFLEIPTQCVTISTACAAGFDAITEGADRIKRGEADVVIAGGTGCPISMLPMANFDSAAMSSRMNLFPEKASRPFDRKRDSGVLSEGCGIVVLENLDHALARGINPYLEIQGYGVRTDPDSHFPGSGFEASMKEALANSARSIQDIDYICAWGPSHPILDRIETEMIKRVFGNRAYSLAVSSIKGVTGNPLAAAGPMMLVSCCLMIRNNLIPPTANYEEPDPDCDLDYVPNVARQFKVQYALLNAHGIGGANSSMVVNRIQNGI